MIADCKTDYKLYFLALELPSSWENFNHVKWIDYEVTGNIMMEFDGVWYYLLNRICESDLEVAVLESEIEGNDQLLEWPGLPVLRQWKSRVPK